MGEITRFGGMCTFWHRSYKGWLGLVWSFMPVIIPLFLASRFDSRQDIYLREGGTCAVNEFYLMIEGKRQGWMGQEAYFLLSLTFNFSFKCYMFGPFLLEAVACGFHCVLAQWMGASLVWTYAEVFAD